MGMGGNPIVFEDRFGLAKCRYSISAHTVICTSNDGRRRATSGPEGVFSGIEGECRNNPDCAEDKSRGPVPPGTYEMIRSEKYGGSWWLAEDVLSRQMCKLGFGRCEFFFHLGSISLGCITVDKSMEAAVEEFSEIRALLDSETSNTMEVIS